MFHFFRRRRMKITDTVTCVVMIFSIFIRDAVNLAAIMATSILISQSLFFQSFFPFADCAFRDYFH
jgi:hypothetical protein